MAKRRHDGGEEQRRLEVGMRANEGARELGREGKMGRWGPGVLLAFYRVRREAEVAGIGRAAAVNGVLNGVITGVKGWEEVWRKAA
jgi:hypothetical protein